MMGMEQRFVRSYRERLADHVDAELERIDARLTQERALIAHLMRMGDKDGADACMDAIADLEADQKELQREMPEEGPYR